MIQLDESHLTAKQRRAVNLARSLTLPRPSFLGVDPGADTGLALWNPDDELLDLVMTVDFWTATAVLTALPADRLVVVLEDPNLNPATFGRGGGSTAKKQRIAQNVGKNMRDAQLLRALLEQRGILVRRVEPGMGDQKSKWTESTFRNLTGWEGHVRQDGIDAARMVFGLEGSYERWRGLCTS